MPGGETVAEARPRPARRGCRGGWRARRARERGSGDQLTALDTGANGPRRVECHQSPDNDYRRGDRDPPESQRASCLSSAPPPRLDRHRQLNDRLDSSYKYIYDRQQLLAVRHQLDGDASRGVTDILQRNLPAHLIRRHGLSQPCGAEGGDPQTISLGPAQPRLSGRIPAQLPRPTLDQTRRPDNHTGAIKHHITLELLNIQSLLPKLPDIRQETQQSKADILCFTETNLKTDTPDRLVSLPGYNIYRRDRVLGRKKSGGGVAIFTKNNYQVTRADSSLPTCSSSHAEPLWLNVKLDRRRSSIIGLIYRPPSTQGRI